MSPETAEQESPATQSVDWNAMLAPYRRPVMWKSLFQLITTAVLLAGFWFAILWSLDVGYWLTLLLAVPAAFMVVRLFMLQHDCGHGSFFRSQKLNNIVGTKIKIVYGRVHWEQLLRNVRQTRYQEALKIVGLSRPWQ